MIVYALLDPETGHPRYVGKTHRTAQRRLRRHLAPSSLTGDTHKERWIRALLRRGTEPRIEVLTACHSAEDLNDAERFFVAWLRYLGARLTNATPGGDGAGARHTEAAKNKIRVALSGKPKSEAHRRNVSAAQVGRGLGTSLSEETREKIRRAKIGKPMGPRRPPPPLTTAQVVKRSIAQGGRPFVDQYGARYDAQAEAARALGLNVAHVNEVLHGKRRHTKGFVFRFVDDLRDCRAFPEVRP